MFKNSCQDFYTIISEKIISRESYLLNSKVVEELKKGDKIKPIEFIKIQSPIPNDNKNTLQRIHYDKGWATFFHPQLGYTMSNEHNIKIFLNEKKI